jgi:hypothetical protein
MSDIAAASHPRRRNLDGSLDSICLNCLATIINGRRETDAADDDDHDCNPSFTVRPAGPQRDNLQLYKPSPDTSPLITQD